MTTAATDERSLALSERAARRIAALKQREKNGDALRLRVAVHGGGCSGFQYTFSFDDQVGEDDRLFERDGVEIVVDDMSLDLLAGSEVDFIEELIGSSFQVRNPNAASSCGCGNSFAI